MKLTCSKIFMAAFLVTAVFAGAAVDALGLHNWAKKHLAGE